MDHNNKSSNSILGFFRNSITKLALSSVIIFGCSSIAVNFYNYNKQAQELKIKVLEQQRNRLKEIVVSAKDYINYSRDLTEKRLKDSLKTRVEEAIDVMGHHYKYHEHEDLELQQKHIVDIIRPLRFFNGRGYYFVTRLDGLELLFADKPELENKNLWDMKSSDGVYVIREMVKIVRENGQGYIAYDWTKPNEIGDDHRKIAYVKYFEPLNAFVGSGDYLEDVEDDIKEEVLSRVLAIKFENEGYVFSGQWDGISLTGPAKGKNMLNVRDKNGKYIVRELISLAKSGGGFLEYEMPALDDKKSAPKLSYVEAIDDWGWYIGAGAYKEDIQVVVDYKQKELLLNNLLYLVLTIFVCLLVLFVAVNLQKKVSKSLADDINVLEKFFKEAVDKKAYIDSSKLEYDEFVRIAQLTNQMLEEKNDLEAMMLQTEKMDSLGKLSAGMAHEINNPLSAVLQGAQNLRRRLDISEEKTKKSVEDSGLDIEAFKNFLSQRKILKFTQMIEESGARAASIVSNMLSFSRSSQGQHEAISTEEIINKVLGYLSGDYDLRADYDFKKISIKVEIDEDAKQIYGIANEIEQVLLNIIKNAAQAVIGVVENREAKIKIKVTSRQGTSVIEVKDNGLGIDAQMINRLFDPFYTTKPVGKGTGLGLFVVYFIVTKHHKGKLSVNSVPGQFTSFKIELPKK